MGGSQEVYCDSGIETIPREESMNGQSRASIKPGNEVMIVLKKDQRTGVLTRGIVKDILTKSPTHPHGIKVRLTSGQVGRVKQQILQDVQEVG